MPWKHFVLENPPEASARSPRKPRLLASGLAALLVLATSCTSAEEPAPSEAAAPPALAQTSQRLFTNGSFEDGDLSGWTTSTNLNLGITIPPTSVGDLNLQPGGTNRTFAREAAGGPETQIPAGLDATASLRWPKYGNWAAVVNENGQSRNVNRLVQSASIGPADVDPADGKAHVRFALAPVLQNPNHTASQQPYIYIVLRNVTRNEVLWSTFNFANQPGVPWKLFGQVQYTDWQSVDVAPGDASLSVGDTVELEIIAAGCSQGAHWGHVYVDGFGAFLPGLSIAARAPQAANDDTDLTYTYLAKNSGATPTENTLVTIVLPENTTYVSFTNASCVRSTDNGVDTLTCNLGTLNPTASAQFEVTVHIDAGATGVISHGNYNIQADGVSPLIGPLVETTLSAGVAYADLAVTLTDAIVALEWGDPVHYTLVVTNNGPAAVSGASIDDDFPAQLTGISWTCAGADGATCATGSGSGNIHVLNDLPAGGRLTFTVDATLITGTGSGSLDNRASVTAPASAQDNDTTNNVAVDIDGIGTLYTLTVSKDPAGTGAGTLISSPSAISCDASCASADARFLEGSQVSLTATAAPGSTFAGWSGACANSPNPCVLDINAATSVSALFTLNTYSVTSSTLGGGGTVTCPSPVGHGQSATCTITPEPGYVLATLTDDGVDVLGSVLGGTYVLSNVTEAHEVVATFKKALGTSCAESAECLSNVCADGVCCSSACDGQCEACDVAGSMGTCSPVMGAPHAGRAACASDGSACGGACDGTLRTACTYPSAATQCRDASCSAGVATQAASCDGAGACPPAQTQECSPYVCGPDACLTHCTLDADCAGDRWCSEGTCVDRKDNGGSCTADSQCASGSCADGVCCNTSCDGQCEACDVAGSVGTCSAVTGAPRGDRPACGSDGSECGGVCDGTQRDSCAYPSTTTQCGTASCSEGVAITGGSCSGAGTCAVQTQACGPYACGDTACRTTCASDSECSAEGICLSGECRPRADRSLWRVEGSGCSSTGSGSTLGAGLVLAVLALLARRRRGVGVVLSAAAVLSVPTAARAQDDVSRSFLVERFQPQPGQADVLGVQSARTGEDLSFSARLFASYAHQPLRLVSTADSNFRRLMLGSQSQLTLAASMAFQDRFEVGLAVPVLLHQTTESVGLVDPRLEGGLSSTAIEDLRISAKASLLRDEDYGLAVSLPLSLPTAPGDNYVGGAGVTVNPTIIGELAGPRGASLMANAGLLLGRSRRFLNLELGTAFTYGVGGKVDLVPRWNLSFLTTLAGEVGLSNPSAETSPLELLLGLRWGFLRNLEMTVGAGPGLTNGYGTPRYRVLAALSYVPGTRRVQVAPAPIVTPAPPPPAPAPPPPLPPLVARADETRVLAGQATTVNLLGNDEGAPGEALRLVEVASASGGQVELSPDGTLEYTARPGFSGREELTYRITGADGREATGTFVVNVEAPPPPAAVVVDQGKIRVLEKVNFATNKADVLPESLHILDDVFQIMSGDSSISKVRIEAHTDNRGSPAYNKDLSDRRARWVKEYLIQKGIAPSRLDSSGFGQTRPIATNDTTEGRATNRRVEFAIVE